MRNLPPVVKNLIIINALMLLITYVLEGRFGISLTKILGLYYYESELFEPYQIVSHMFMHGGLPHLFFNMFALFMFGGALENHWGSKRFFIYYVFTGLGAAFIHTLVLHFQFAQISDAIAVFYSKPTPEIFSSLINQHFSGIEFDRAAIKAWYGDPGNASMILSAKESLNELYQSRLNVPTVGASGAVYGVLLGFGMLFPNVVLMLLIPPMPIKAKYLVIIYGCLELFLGISQPGSQIAHFAHLGGMIFGIILILYWKKNRTNNYF